MKNEIFKEIFLEELESGKMFTPDMIEQTRSPLF